MSPPTSTGVLSEKARQEAGTLIPASSNGIIGDHVGTWTSTPLGSIKAPLLSLLGCVRESSNRKLGLPLLPSGNEATPIAGSLGTLWSPRTPTFMEL